MYLVEKTSLPEVLILTPNLFKDERGTFFESYSEKSLQQAGIIFHAKQENHIINIQANVIRGLHFQNAPYAQAKIVRCTKGVVDDVAVDLRRGSPTYLQWVMVELSEENHRQLYLPKGFAHGVISRSKYSEIQYVVNEPYCPQADRNIRYDDPYIGVQWGSAAPVLSAKDRAAPLLTESDCNFVWEN